MVGGRRQIDKSWVLQGLKQPSEMTTELSELLFAWVLPGLKQKWLQWPQWWRRRTLCAASSGDLDGLGDFDDFDDSQVICKISCSFCVYQTWKRQWSQTSAWPAAEHKTVTDREKNYTVHTNTKHINTQTQNSERKKNYAVHIILWCTICLTWSQHDKFTTNTGVDSWHCQLDSIDNFVKNSLLTEKTPSGVGKR